MTEDSLTDVIRSVIREETQGLHKEMQGLHSKLDNMNRRLVRIENTVNGIATTVSVLDDEVTRLSVSARRRNSGTPRLDALLEREGREE